MINILLLVCAFILSSAAAYYSIAGLITIFSAAAIPIAVMGGALEVSKLVVTSWLYRNWKDTAFAMKAYFMTAIAILMLLTSMGIFGFLSKAHSDQGLVSGDAAAKLALIDEKIKTEKENIDANRKIIAQLDLQVNETIARSSTSANTGGGTNTSSNASSNASSGSGDAGVARSVAIRRSQAKERSAAQEAILSAQTKIGKYQEERAPIAAEVRKVEAEVGPIKYIAALIYGQEATSQETLEQAVRWVIILIVAVFDPLAVLMFIAYNQTLMRKKEQVEPETLPEPEPIVEEPPPPPIVKKKKKRKPIKKVIPPPEPKVEYEYERQLIPVKD